MCVILIVDKWMQLLVSFLRCFYLVFPRQEWQSKTFSPNNYTKYQCLHIWELSLPIWKSEFHMKTICMAWWFFRHCLITVLKKKNINSWKNRENLSMYYFKIILNLFYVLFSTSCLFVYPITFVFKANHIYWIFDNIKTHFTVHMGPI